MADIALNLVVIRAEDIDRAAAFYGLLGLEFQKHRHGSGPEHYASEERGIVFEIYPRQKPVFCGFPCLVGNDYVNIWMRVRVHHQV